MQLTSCRKPEKKQKGEGVRLPKLLQDAPPSIRSLDRGPDKSNGVPSSLKMLMWFETLPVQRGPVVMAQKASTNEAIVRAVPTFSTTVCRSLEIALQ